MQAAEDRRRHDGRRATANIVRAWIWHALGETLVGPAGVEVADVLVEHRAQVTLTKNHDVIEALPADALKETFTGCIHQWRETDRVVLAELALAASSLLDEAV